MLGQCRRRCSNNKPAMVKGLLFSENVNKHNLWASVGSMLVHLLRRWPDIVPVLVQRSMFAGKVTGKSL